MSARSAHSPMAGTDPQGAAATRSSRSPSATQLRRKAEDEARRAFLRTVSHELRTPLNAIIGFSEIIAGEMLGPIGEPRYREHAASVRDSGLQMLALVNDILEIARLEADVVDLDPRAERLDEACACAAKAVAGLAVARGVTIVCDVDPPDLTARADARALHDVLRRLLESAVASSSQGGSVRLRARPLARSVRIEVEDDGPGVAPGDQRRLMRPFQQGETLQMRGGQGAGLGLAVTRLLCKAMDGRLRLSAGAGGGLTAAVRLPAG